MSENLLQFFHRSRHLVCAVFTHSSSAGMTNHNDDGVKPYSIVKVESGSRQDSPEMVALLERIHHRLDTIEEKIDHLLMPFDTTKH